MRAPEGLAALVDRQQITDLIYRYCRSVDRLDIPLGHSVWHEGLDRRISIRDFDEARDVTAMVEHAVGRRDRDDPSCAVLP